MMHFLAIQSTYHGVECALFRDATLIDTASIDKTVASSMLIPTLNTMLSDHACSIQSLSFIATNSGPAPFTTLRVVISTVNGIQFAQAISLVSINAFDALFHEWDDLTITTAIVLNAFNNDIFVALKKAGDCDYISGYGQIENIAKFLAREAVGSIRFLGNGFAMYRATLEQCLGDRIVVPALCPPVSSIYHVGLLGLELWSKGSITKHPLKPAYLKGSIDILPIAS